jgi:ribonuclease HII
MPYSRELNTLKSCYRENVLEAGCDEAGRGCLAGPVFAAAVILPENFYHSFLNDSKKLSECNRYVLRDEIEKAAVCCAIEYINSDEIDKLNIFRATVIAMHRAINSLTVKPEYLIIDGNRFIKYRTIQHKCIVKGDSKYFSIAAASILAKTYRDDYMKQIHKEYDKYGWDNNKGYATEQHREAIKRYGITPYHRKSFRLVNNQLNLKFNY